MGRHTHANLADCTHPESTAVQSSALSALSPSSRWQVRRPALPIPPVQLAAGWRSALHHELSRVAIFPPIQAKLAVSQPGDEYEREAEHVADAIGRMPEPQASPRAESSGPARGVAIQRRDAEGVETLRGQPEEVGETEEEEEFLQASEIPGHQPEAPRELEAELDAMRGAGQFLPRSIGAFFERHLDHDFSRVRIHTDARADTAAVAVKARAFTVGNDIVFRAGQYAPDRPEGRRLLAHELTHVVQQCAAPRMAKEEESVQTKPPGGQAARTVRSVGGRMVYRKLATLPTSDAETRRNVVVILGRPGHYASRKKDMVVWRMPARLLASTVLEGPTIEKAFEGLRKLKFPIHTLYIIAHGGTSGFLEETTVGGGGPLAAEQIQRLKKTVGSLGKRAPKVVHLLVCEVGRSPGLMTQIGKVLGASEVRAPVNEVRWGGAPFTVSPRKIRKERYTDAELRKLVEKKKYEVLQHYEFVLGVPHPGPSSREEKLRELLRVLRKVGGIPYVGQKYLENRAKPYWEVEIETRESTDSQMPLGPMAPSVTRIDLLPKVQVMVKSYLPPIRYRIRWTPYMGTRVGQIVFEPGQR